MTDEPKKDTEAFVEKTGAKYAYAYDKGGKLKSYFGISGIPHAVLVDPTGTVVWEGHPGGLDAATIQKHLAGALEKPLWEWGPSAKDTKSALLKRKYGEALESAAKISEEDGGPAIKSAIERLVKSRVEAMKSALAEGNFLTAQDLGTELSKALDGLPEEADAQQVLADIKANKDADKVMKVQKTIRGLKAQRLGKRKELEKAIVDLKKIQKDFAGTYAAKEAEAFQTELEARKRKE